LRTSGYVSTLTNPDDLVLNEIYDYFTMKLTTNLKIVNPGQYQFRFVAADDNVQLLIDGVNYMNRTCCGDVTGANITLAAGNHSLEVRFSEYVGPETLQLQWRAAATGLDVTTTWQAIADNKLFLPAAPALSCLVSSGQKCHSYRQWCRRFWLEGSICQWKQRDDRGRQSYLF
jgi:hypothetical protein